MQVIYFFPFFSLCPSVDELSNEIIVLSIVGGSKMMLCIEWKFHFHPLPLPQL
jgi:hypothetical protein